MPTLHPICKRWQRLNKKSRLSWPPSVAPARKINIRRIEFRDQIAQFRAFAVTTADHPAQMAAPDYLEQLPSLHAEFQESYYFFSTPRRNVIPSLPGT
jgi:hypothetical protein